MSFLPGLKVKGWTLFTKGNVHSFVHPNSLLLRRM
jgi:hypothetical protein